MSGFFGNVTPIQVPDFAATAARAQDFAMRRQAMDQRNALTRFFQDNAQGFAAADPAKRMNVLAMLAAQGPEGAAMALPQMQSLREEMEWANAGQQPAPMPNAQAPAAGQGGDYLARLISMESGGDPNARNPRSSATGAAQFIDGTWLRFAQANPQLFQGMSREQILAARTNPDLSRQAADWYRRENLGALQAQGLPANDGTAALAHRFGAGDAARLLRADPNAPIASVVSPQVMQANPDLAGRTVGQVVGNYAQRFGGDTIPAQNAAPAGEGAAIQRTPAGHVLVPGYDPALIDRAHAMPNNPRARQFLEQYQRALSAHLQVMGLTQRGERNPPPTVTLGEGPHGPAGVYRQERDGSLTRLGDPPPATQNINLNPGDTPRARADTATLTDMQRSATEARQLSAMFDRAEQAVRAVPEGQGAQLLPIIGQTARALGIEIAGTSEAEVLRSLTNGMATLQRVPGSGATTDFEMRLYMQAVPRLGNTREGNLKLIDLGRRLAARRIEEANIWRRHAGEPDVMDRINALPPVFTDEDRRFLANDAVPVNDQGIPGPGGRGTAIPPPPPGFRPIR